MANSRQGGSSDWQRRQAAQVREAERQRKAAEKEARERYIAERKRQVERKNQQLTDRISELESVLRRGLGRPTAIDPQSLMKRTHTPALDLGDLATPVRAPDWSLFVPSKPGAISKMFGGEARYEQRLAAARAEYDKLARAWEADEVERQRQVAKKRAEHAERVRRDEAAVRD
jgi:restriction system protein